MAYPKDLQYTKDHEWLRQGDGKTVTVGITQFAQEALGDVVYVELPKVGEKVTKGKPFGVVESTKAVSEIFSPVDGTIVEVNSPLADSPETVNKDPYEEGWMIRVEIAGAPEPLMDAAAYAQFIKDSAH